MNKYYTGALKSPKDLRNYRIAKVGKPIDLPTSFELPHTKIKNQGSVSSCVAHSISEALESKDNITYSTGWIYGYRPECYYQGKGMVTIDALKTIKNVGYIENKDLNVNVEMNKAKELINKDINKYVNLASKKKISYYAELHTIDEIKETLYVYKTPVIICIDTDNHGLKIDKNYIAYLPTNEPFGGHAVLCYGWREQGLLIQNSWGENWGNKGTFILPYVYPFYEAWFISFAEKEEDNPIEKPNIYWLREFIMYIINFIRKIIKKLREE